MQKLLLELGRSDRTEMVYKSALKILILVSLKIAIRYSVKRKSVGLYIIKQLFHGTQNFEKH